MVLAGRRLCILERSGQNDLPHIRRIRAISCARALVVLSSPNRCVFLVATLHLACSSEKLCGAMRSRRRVRRVQGQKKAALRANLGPPQRTAQAWQHPIEAPVLCRAPAAQGWQPYSWPCGRHFASSKRPYELPSALAVVALHRARGTAPAARGCPHVQSAAPGGSAAGRHPLAARPAARRHGPRARQRHPRPAHT